MITPTGSPDLLAVEPGDPDEPATRDLLEQSELYAHSLYPDESVHLLPRTELTSATTRFLVARQQPDGLVLGCGAVVLHDGWGEIKRMFVAVSARRRGAGDLLLQALEEAARAEGVRALLLETGVAQPEAIALYRRCGYQERGPFEGYHDDPLSVFMEKELHERHA